MLQCSAYHTRASTSSYQASSHSFSSNAQPIGLGGAPQNNQQNRTRCMKYTTRNLSSCNAGRSKRASYRIGYMDVLIPGLRRSSAPGRTSLARLTRRLICSSTLFSSAEFLTSGSYRKRMDVIVRAVNCDSIRLPWRVATRGVILMQANPHRPFRGGSLT